MRTSAMPRTLSRWASSSHSSSPNLTRRNVPINRTRVWSTVIWQRCSGQAPCQTKAVKSAALETHWATVLWKNLLVGKAALRLQSWRILKRVQAKTGVTDTWTHWCSLNASSRPKKWAKWDCHLPRPRTMRPPVYIQRSSIWTPTAITQAWCRVPSRATSRRRHNPLRVHKYTWLIPQEVAHRQS